MFVEKRRNQEQNSSDFKISKCHTDFGVRLLCKMEMKENLVAYSMVHPLLLRTGP